MVKGSKIRRYDLDHQYKKKFHSLVEGILKEIGLSPENKETDDGLKLNFQKNSGSFL